MSAIRSDTDRNRRRNFLISMMFLALIVAGVALVTDRRPPAQFQCVNGQLHYRPNEFMPFDRLRDSVNNSIPCVSKS